MSESSPAPERKQGLAFLISGLLGGGAERVAVSLLGPLRNEAAAPIPLVLLENRVALAIPQNTPVSSLSGHLRGDLHKLTALLVGAWQLRRLVRKEGFTVVLSFLERANSVNVLAHLLGSPHWVAISEHTDPSANYKRRALRNLIAKALIRLLYRRAYAVVAVSHGVKRNLVEQFGVPNDLVSVIYCPLALGQIDRLTQEDPRFPWFDLGVPVIVTAGRLEEPKGQAHLLRAFAAVRQRQPCRLMLLGEGSSRGELERPTVALKVENDVAFLGWQENPYQYLSRATVFASPSLWKGFGTSLVEAMACGLPGVSFNCPASPRDILANGEFGVLVPVRDEHSLAMAILALLNDQKQRLGFARRAKARALDSGVPGIAREYRGLLEGRSAGKQAKPAAKQETGSE